MRIIVHYLGQDQFEYKSALIPRQQEKLLLALNPVVDQEKSTLLIDSVEWSLSGDSFVRLRCQVLMPPPSLSNPKEITL